MFLGLDVGTSAVKAVLVNPEGRLVAQADAPLRLHTPHPHWCEQNPADWWTATRRACADLARRNAREWREVQAIGLSGQMHGAVLLDAEDTVIRPAILWNDSRAHAECQAMAQADPDLGMIAGVLALPGLTAPKMRWLATHEPGNYRRIARLLLPKDYIGFRLHGGYVSDPSDAAGTLLFDQARRVWSDRLCALAQVDPLWLPEVRGSAEVAGQLTALAATDLGLTAGTPVASGAGDTAAGAVGIGAIGEGDAVLSMGTSGQLFVPTATYRPKPQVLVHAFAHAVPDTWYQMAAMLNGARPLAWFAEATGADLPTLLAEADGAGDAPLFLPYLTGERTPHGDPHMRGAFFGLETNTSRGEMMRGVLEGVAFSFADGAAALAAAGSPVEAFLAVGGGTRSDLLMQIMADVMQVPIARAAGASAGPGFGAARLASVMQGEANWSDLAVKPEIERAFTPDPNRQDALCKKLDAFRRLYECLKAMRKDVQS